MRIYLVSAVASGLLCSASVTASAASLADKPGFNPAIEKVHGYHRDCVGGHRNTRDGDRVACGPRYYSAPGVNVYVGPGMRGWRGDRDRNWNQGRDRDRDGDRGRRNRNN